MNARTSSITRSGLLAVLVIALLAPGLAGCGVGPATKKEKISKTAVTYLNALADGDTATACAQLTHRAQGEHCQATLTARLPRLDRAALTSAADGSMDFSVHGVEATAGLSEPKGARLVLTEIAGDWRIDSGYTLSTAVSAKIPATPVGRQLKWALAQLNGDAPKLRPSDVTARFTPEFRKVVMPVPAIIATLTRTAAERGPFTLTGFAYPPSRTQAVALIETKAGERGSLRVKVDSGTPARITGLEVSEAPPAVESAGRYSGRFDVGGRKLFLHCTGSGTPTVVFQGGLTTDWVGVQNQIARFTRACSYDPANGLWGRSDPAPTPRTAKDVVADLHALLAAANVPGPYMLTGHSDGGLFVQLYASTHPDQVAGLVLIDAVSDDYYTRRTALLKKLLPPAAWKMTMRQLHAHTPALIDPEQIDMQTSQAQLRSALAAAPLRSMPLSVLSHGRVDQPDIDPRVNRADEHLWQTLQNELAALEPNSRHVIASKSGHDIQHEQPELVVSAIRAVVDGARDPSSWK